MWISALKQFELFSSDILQNLPDGRAHNVLTNDETDFAYVVGARPRTSECRSGLIFLDLSGMLSLLLFLQPLNTSSKML